MCWTKTTGWRKKSRSWKRKTKITKLNYSHWWHTDSFEKLFLNSKFDRTTCYVDEFNDLINNYMWFYPKILVIIWIKFVVPLTQGPRQLIKDANIL